MIVRFYLTNGQQIDTRPGVDGTMAEVEEDLAKLLAGIERGDYGSRRQVRPPACVTVTVIGGNRQILMTAQIVRVVVIEV